MSFITGTFLESQLNIRNSKFKTDLNPLDNFCNCLVCERNISRSYIHHLSNIGDMLSSIYITLHNLYHYIELMRELRESIINKNFSEVAENRLKDYEKGDIDLEN